MHRKLISLLLSLLLLSALLPGAWADSDLPRVVDRAGLLSESEREELGHKSEAIREEFEMDVVILTVDNLEGKTPQDYADDYYDDNGYGCGQEMSGLLFLLAMEDRDWYISTTGNAIYALTDYGIQQLGETALPDFSAGRYGAGFDAFLNALPEYLDAYEQGTPLDGYADTSGSFYHGDQGTVVHYREPRSPNLLVSLLIGLAAAAVTVLVMRSCMNTRRPQHSACGYLADGSFHLRIQRDMFLYSDLHKSARPEQNNNSGGGGSSVHTGSSGSSHGGGGGKF